MITPAKETFKPLARVGYAARGVIYVVIGYFSALAAIGAGRPMDSRQALGEVLAGNSRVDPSAAAGTIVGSSQTARQRPESSRSVPGTNPI